ncbi:hypothetical protein [Burkholderia sp. IDO3]|uniref:hypothetical protein n=1 Tax=Burkholderia sp. IDO3 TaxID=1705310 RepID=UPI001177E0C5|nr:hypothetical protein [Burkholderia sp. IDO3]
MTPRHAFRCRRYAAERPARPDFLRNAVFVFRDDFVDISLLFFSIDAQMSRFIGYCRIFSPAWVALAD